MTRDKASLLAFLRRQEVPPFVIGELLQGETRINNTTVADAGALHSIYARRSRVQSDVERSAPKFRGFSALLKNLAKVPGDTPVEVITITAPQREMVLFRDTRHKKLFGLLHAKVEHAEFWRDYVDQRSRLAYQRGLTEAQVDRRR